MKADHYLLISSFIKSKIEDLDDIIAQREKEKNDLLMETNPEMSEKSESHQFTLGSVQPKCTISSFEETHSDDLAFRDFRKKLGLYLTGFLNAHSINLPDDQCIQVSVNDEVCTVLLRVWVLLKKL